MVRMVSGFIVLSIFAGCSTLSSPCGNMGNTVVKVGPYTPEEQARHQAWIQACFDAASPPCVFRFCPGEYYLSDPCGLRVPAGATLLLEGARFVCSEALSSDGQAFLIEDASGVTIHGGEIVGQRQAWDPGTNIAGVRVRGEVSEIRIDGLECRDLSSNAVGVFGKDEAHPIRNIALTNVTGINCCNFYGDYLEPARGPAKGSDRSDQGAVALYYVEGWRVDGCRFEHSQSDGTHFFHAHNGQFVNSIVSDSKMGGYFLEGCEQVVAANNLIQRNGSRGVTIERDSRYCTLVNNIVRSSGREGLWMPDVRGILVSSNLFRENGQKDDQERDCEIRLDEGKEYETATGDIRIEGNFFYTQGHQTAAIYFGGGVEAIPVSNNTFIGAAPETVSASK